MKNHSINIHRLIKLVLLSILVLITVWSYLNPRPTIKDGYIQRPYSQLLRFLEQDPADISLKVYEPTIPKIIRNDIDRMLASNGDLSILYYTDDPSIYIQIVKDSDSSTGIKLIVHEDYYEHIQAEDNISMYRSKRSIVIYAPDRFSSRNLQCYKLGENALDYVSLNSNYLDLYGTNFHYDTVRAHNKDLSLIKNGNDFMFYKFGKQVGKTWHFPGGEILKFNYYYILDDKHDMYYLYYCSHPDNPWIKFVKVDSGISSITDANPFNGNFMETSANVSYPIYFKDNKEYVGVSDMYTEKACGQSSGGNSTLLDVDALDFDITILQVSPDNLSSITFTKHIFDEHQYDWYLKYSYTVKSQILYYEERINGLDSYLTTIIPEEELSEFDEKTVSIDQLDDALAKLKKIYERYEYHCRF